MSLAFVSPVNKQRAGKYGVSIKRSTQMQRRKLCTSMYRGSPERVSLAIKNLPEDFRAVGNQGTTAYEEEVGFCNPYSQFSPEFIQERALRDVRDIFALTKRFFEITFSLGAYATSLSYDALSGVSDQNVPQRAAELRNLLCRLGPVFIKAGQTLANRPDVVREDYMRELTYLQDDVPQFPNEKAFQILEKQLGRPVSEVFSSISQNPVAAASLGQVYKATLKSTGQEVAIKIQRPGVESIIYRDLYLFRQLATFINGWTLSKLGCNAALIIDEFAQKLLEELDYRRELLNLQDFYRNFDGDKCVKIPKAYSSLCSEFVLVMEWIDGVRCTDIDQVRRTVNVEEFIRVGVVSGLRQLLEFGLFHGDPHPGNIFAMRDGRIAYVDFGNVAQLSQSNKEVLIDAVVHAVNEDYEEMAGDFVRLGFLSQGVDITPIVPALESIWQDSSTKSMATFNFRTVTTQFNKLVFQYPIRIPQRYALVIRSLLIQEGICMALEPAFKFLEVAYPYVARRLLTDNDPGLRTRLFQVLVRGNTFQWLRLQNLILLAKGTGESSIQLKNTMKEGIKFILSPKGEAFREQLLRALTQNNRLAIAEISETLALLDGDIMLEELLLELVQDAPMYSRELLLAWSSRVLTN